MLTSSLLTRLSGRKLLTSAALAGAIALAGCNADDLARDARANKPLPAKLVSEMTEKNMDKGSPILVRIFKQESELEVWKQDRNGQYALLKTYPICRWSGELGPKIREGDRQAPEGFYTITPAQMNPNSSYYLSFNMGYPNAFDKALGRTGSQLMVHGDCSSRGCYAMTDEQISEIYALGRESFFGGQRAFQVQAYPFRMTPANMAKHRNNPHMAFWKMIKRGYDHFEVTRTEPKVDVCEKHYVFDAAPVPGATQALSFNPSGKCPSYEVPAEIAQAVEEKTRSDERQMAELVSRGTPTVAVRTGVDGGMHPVFASKLGVQNERTGSSSDYALAAYTPAPGTIPPHVNPPKASENTVTSVAAVNEPPVPAAAAASRSSKSSGSFLDRLGSAVGLSSAKREADPPPTRAPSAPAAKPVTTPSPAPKPVQTAKPAQPAVQQAQAPAPQPVPGMRGTTAPPTASIKASDDSDTSRTMAGAAPVRPANSFESRWSAFR